MLIRYRDYREASKVFTRRTFGILTNRPHGIVGASHHPNNPMNILVKLLPITIGPLRICLVPQSQLEVAVAVHALSPFLTQVSLTSW